MNLTEDQRRICNQVINAFETGSAEGDYSNISIYADGPHGVRQITYGRAQTTEYGNLRDLVSMYVDARGIFGAELRPFLDRIGSDPALVGDKRFKQLLRDAGKTDPVMRTTQDEFFDRFYFQPAMRWAEQHGFSLPLSALVIFDSFIHSGSILWTIRNRFPESVPSSGGDEKSWIAAYVAARHDWLAHHPKTILHATVYRTACFRDEIRRHNWDLSRRPIRANGVAIV
jgi:chitosanase